MERRRVFKLLLFLLSSYTRASKEKKSAEEEPTPVLYGQVEAVEPGRLWVAGRALQPDSPLLPYLAPGMVVQVEGKKLKVLSPHAWAYYQGPGEPLGIARGRIRAWWKEEVLWHVWPGKLEETLLVARYRQSAWLSTPQAIQLPKPPKEGWWLLKLDGLKVLGMTNLDD